MTNTGFTSPSNKICFGGSPTIQELKVETATNMYPGRFVVRGTNDDDIIVANGLKPVCGILGYEDATAEFMPESISTLYAANAQAPVLSGRFIGLLKGGLAAKTVATKNDLLLSWGDGQVVPGVMLGGRIAAKIPWSKSTSEVSTVTLPAGAVVRDVVVDVVTNESSGTIDVGTLSTASGDADGFLDGESLTTAGIVQHNAVDATAANITVGALLEEVEIKDATGTPVYYGVPTGYLVPTGGKVLTYTTSDTTATVAGFLYVVIESPGIRVVGKAGNSVSAASAAADIQIEANI